MVKLNNIFSGRQLDELRNNIVQKMMVRFKYLRLIYQELDSIVLNAIEKNKSNYGQINDLKKVVYNDVQTILLELLRKKLNDKDTNYLVINDYINFKLEDSDEVDSALKSIKRLISFFKRFSFVPELDLLIRLYNENVIFSSLLKVIVDSNIDEICRGNTEKIFHDSIFILMIEMYCDINKIEINNSIIEEEDTEDFFEPDTEINLYREISRITLLSPEEEKELLSRVKVGDILAKNELVERNMPLVVSIAKKYQGLGLEPLDLIQEGAIGLMDAIDKYDETKSNKLSTSATTRIKHAITRAINNNGRNIRITVRRKEEILKFQKVRKNLTIQLGYEPSLDIIATQMGLSLSKVEELYLNQNDTISLNNKVSAEEDGELEDFVSSDYNLEELVLGQSMVEEILKAFEECGLNRNEKIVLRYVLRLDNQEKMSLEDIGNMIGVKKMRTSQIVTKGLEKLRKYLIDNKIVDPNVYLNNNRRNEDYKESSLKYETVKRLRQEIRAADVKKDDSLYGYLRPYISTNDEKLVRRIVDYLVISLSSIDKKILYKMYDNDLKDTSFRKDITEKEIKYYYYKLVPRMKKRIKEIEEELSRKSDDITQDDKKIEKIIVQEEQVNISPLETNDSKKQSYFIDEISRDERIKILKIFRNDDTFSKMLNSYGINNAIVIILSHGYIDGKIYSNKAIADFLRISVDDVIRIEQNYLSNGPSNGISRTKRIDDN